jgi:hypothetical protein
MHKVPNDVVMEAIAAVVAQVPFHMRDSVSNIMASICDAQYQQGYLDGTNKAIEVVEGVSV